MKINHLQPRTKQTQSKPILLCSRLKIPVYARVISFTIIIYDFTRCNLQHFKGIKRMNVNFCAAGYYESKPTFAVRKGRLNNPNVDITTAWSSAARIRLLAGPNLGRIHSHAVSVFLCSVIFG